MATTTTNSSTNSLNGIIQSLFPSKEIPASESDPSQLSHAVYSDIHYTDSEKVEINQWLTTSTHIATSDEDEAKHTERLGSLNTHLSSRTTLLGSKPSIADAALYARLLPTVARWSPEERTGEHGYHHVVRYIDFVQNAPLFGLHLDQSAKVSIDVNDVRFVHKPIDPKEEKQRKKKEKAAAAAAAATATTNGEGQTPLLVGGQGKKGTSNPQETPDSLPKAQDTSTNPSSSVPPPGSSSSTQPKRDKKDIKQGKPAKPPAAAKEAPPLSPSLIDLRVGHILKAIPHPNADSLYVSTIACGDPPGTENTTLDTPSGQIVRTVCSGLNGLIPLEEMQNRKIVAVCNLKPVTMRGVKSAAMVLAASPRLEAGGAHPGGEKEGGEQDNNNSHDGPAVELVTPPSSAQAGERIYFQGWAEGEPEGLLNPKKKVWETLQPGFTTTTDLEVGFEMGRVGALSGKEEGGSGKGEGEGEGEGQRPALGKLVAQSGGICTVKSLKGAVVR